jgi:Cu(I)/Ag(I) efflux system membrane fusion protein
VFTGTIAYVYPSVSTSSRTGRVRIELSNPGIRLRPGMYANIRLAVQGLTEGLVIPRSAVLFTGERAIVFVRHDNNVLMPHEVTTGLVAGNEIEILAGLEEGQQVVTSASFLIDAESNLGASMGEMDMSGDAGTAGSAEIDHSQHGAPAPAMNHSEHDAQPPAMDHSQHGEQNPAMDHSGHGAGAPAMDHSGHTPGMDMEQRQMPQQDDHSGHSGHE